MPLCLSLSLGPDHALESKAFFLAILQASQVVKYLKSEANFQHDLSWSQGLYKQILHNQIFKKA